MVSLSPLPPRDDRCIPTTDGEFVRDCGTTFGGSCPLGPSAKQFRLFPGSAAELPPDPQAAVPPGNALALASAPGERVPVERAPVPGARNPPGAGGGPRADCVPAASSPRGSQSRKPRRERASRHRIPRTYGTVPRKFPGGRHAHLLREATTRRYGGKVPLGGGPASEQFPPCGHPPRPNSISTQTPLLLTPASHAK